MEKAGLLTVQEVASRLNVSRALVYRMAQKGVLACHRIGGEGGPLRVREEALGSEAWRRLFVSG